MTREEAIKTAYENYIHPYSISASVEMLLKGAEIGRMEAIEDACKYLRMNLTSADYTSVFIERFRKAMEKE